MVQQLRTPNSEAIQEEAELYQSLLRTIREYEKKQSPNTNEVKNKTQPGDGAKLIEEALKGKVDPNSDVVNLLERMFVDEGNRHDLQPEGINKIASKKGKVFGDTHDSHKLTPDQIDELKSG
ncbi:uncharacterized protein LOC134275956, partial [Saccostrea cucullata]|uniref:uncharacterized protein LOC134275956 n=1 Tax=Saccostrea cuccullata TaxID=36930 RepID=UPI002ED472C3